MERAVKEDWTLVPAGKIHAATQRLLEALGDNAGTVTARINTDPAFVAKIARLMVGGGYEPSLSHKRARAIMGKNFFGVEEAITHFGVNPPKQQLAYLAEVPWSEEVLTSCKGTHVLVAVFPLPILNIRGITRELENQPLFYPQDWYDKQAFAEGSGGVSWQLVRKETIAGSKSQTWNDQQALLSKYEETPTARIVVYTMIGHFLSTGERLFNEIFVSCVDLDSDGRRVDVGFFGAKGLRVYSWGVDDRNRHIGLSAARKQ